MRNSANVASRNTSGKCPLLAHSGHALLHCMSPLLTQSGHLLGVHFGLTLCCFAQTTKPNQIEDAGGSCVSPVGSGTMQVIRECQVRAVILTELAKDAPEFEDQLLFVAKEWLALAILIKQFNAHTDVAPMSFARQLRGPI